MTFTRIASRRHVPKDIHVPRRWGAALAIVLGTSACEHLDLEEASGERLDYAWEPALTPCAGVVAHGDAFIADVAGQLRLDVGGLETISYAWLTYDTYHELRSTPDHSAGYTQGVDARGTGPLITHELVHAVVDQREHGGLPLLIEGLAVAFVPWTDFGNVWVAPRYDRRDPRPVLTDTQKQGGNALYNAGGGFVTYLLSRYGVDRLFELHGRLGRNATAHRVRRVFEDVYGRSLDDEVERFLGDDTCPDDATDLPRPFACAAPTIPWADPGRWRDLRVLSCDDPAVHGGIYETSDGAAGIDVTVEIPEDGEYELEIVGDPSMTAVVSSCGRCPWLAEDAVLYAGNPVVVSLKAGLHGVSYGAPAAQLSLGGVTITKR